MSRRNLRPKKLDTNAGASPSMASIRSMLGLGRPTSNPKLAEMMGQILGSQRRPSRSDPIQEWLDSYLESMEMYPASIVDRAYDSEAAKIHVTGIFSDGHVTGEFIGGDGQYHVFVNFPDVTPLAGCSCAESRGVSPCIHSFLFLDDLTDRLDSNAGTICARIRHGNFDSKRPRPELYAYDSGKRIRQMLADLVPKHAPAPAVIEDASLLPLVEAASNRVAWNVVLQHGYLEIQPMLQVSKKRGDGWTKGRKLAMESLSEHSDCFSAADRSVRDLVRIEARSYRPSYLIDSVSAIQKLVDEPNVLMNGSPAEVRLFDAALKLQRSADGLRLIIDGSHAGQSHYVFAQGSLIHLRPDANTIQICYLGTQQLACLQSIVKMPQVPLEMESEMIDTAKRLQSLLTIYLPDEVAGKVVEEDYRPALLLRSRTDGALDYGIRLRDSLGTLIKAGSGRMVRSAERGGQPVQIKRSTNREFQIARNVAERFGLPAKESSGSLHDFETALNFIAQAQAAEEESEIEILWDKSSEKPMRLLGTVSSKNVSVGISTKRDWFQLSGSCNFGKESVDLSELISGLQAAGASEIRGDYVRLGEKGWAKISENLRTQFKQLYDSVSQERGSLKFDATSAPAIRSFMAEQVQMKSNQAWEKCLNRLEQAEKLEPTLPADLQADLRDYQHEGFKWLRRLAEWGVGGILADDMGLGKTVQTLAVILDRSKFGPTLVIAPTSVGFNWAREAAKFAPQLDTHLYRETDRADFLQQVGPGSLVVCSYGLALRDAKALAGIEWTTLVLDEAQAIKNSRSKTSAAIATIPADWKVALTGTPVENHLGELWSLFHVVSPGVLGGWEQFRRRFATPIEKNNDQERREALRDRLKPFLLRRTKSQVLKDLPPRSEMNLVIELSAAEREIYNQVRLSAVGEIDQIAKLSDVKDQRFRILALLTRLRQLACSPRLVHDTWQERSSKLKQLCETLHELREENHRVLVFSQFVQHLGLIREMLDEEKITYEYLDGSTTPQARQERVDRFQEGDASVFLISLKAGGTGLNLTAADYVIHMDPWWNPAVEDQATDRAHRIGQDKPVMVYRLISQGTIEEEILKLHDTKRDLVAGIMEGTSAAAKLSTEDLMAMLRA